MTYATIERTLEFDVMHAQFLFDPVLPCLTTIRANVCTGIDLHFYKNVPIFAVGISH